MSSSHRNGAQPSISPKSQSQWPSAEAQHDALTSANPDRPSASTVQPAQSSTSTSRKRKPRNKNKKRRRQSVIAGEADAGSDPGADSGAERPSLAGHAQSGASQVISRETIYRLGRQHGSSESLDSQALLDHRDTGPLQTRRQSIHQGAWPNLASRNVPRVTTTGYSRARSGTLGNAIDDDDSADDNTPLLRNRRASPGRASGYGAGLNPTSPFASRSGHSYMRPTSQHSHESSQRRSSELALGLSRDNLLDYDINNPPSVPNSPKFGPTTPFDDVLAGGDAVIDIDHNGFNSLGSSATQDAVGTPGGLTPAALKKRLTMSAAEGDVCFPQDILSEIAEEDEFTRTTSRADSGRRRRRRAKQWPDLGILADWCLEEKEEIITEGTRARTIDEPLLVEGRLRPKKAQWHRVVDETPYRFTYFNEEFEKTIHSHTISGLLSEGQTFHDLFIPEAPILDDSSDYSDETDEEDGSKTLNADQTRDPSQADLKPGTPPTFTRADMLRATPSKRSSNTSSKAATPAGRASPSVTSPRAGDGPQLGSEQREAKPVRYGEKPVFWLDVLNPSELEMRMLAKVFGIHPLTAEDIYTQDEREKVELFKNYYFVSYRSFEQDASSEDYLEPRNQYIVVFREGVLSFHFSQNPHANNVRRRVRQLKGYLFLTTDWISYALIDDITDAYAPLIESIEEDVDRLDSQILEIDDEDVSDTDSTVSRGPAGEAKRFIREKVLRSGSDGRSLKNGKGGDAASTKSTKDVLRQMGDCRKRVMGLLRLLGTKADVVKGFAKRCNEQWDIAPKSEIGLYLGDIQDHIVTMTGNLSHYEAILSRSHSNYLAQINIRMNERAEQTTDVLNKLTVLGTIVLPMNIVTGLWGMNVRVPGEEGTDLAWFFGITLGLLVAGGMCFMIAKIRFGVV